MKTCIRCRQLKPLEAFHRHSGMKDGRLNKCAACVVECVREWRKSRPNERQQRYARELEMGTRTRKRAQSEIVRMTPEQRRESRKAVSARDFHKRRLAISRPLTELDVLTIEEAVDVRERRAAITGFKWHIDHRVPMRHPRASGLHNAFNLQVVPASWNVRKHNRSMADFWPMGY